jgi:hypothetical protein
MSAIAGAPRSFIKVIFWVLSNFDIFAIQNKKSLPPTKEQTIINNTNNSFMF